MKEHNNTHTFAFEPTPKLVLATYRRLLWQDQSSWILGSLVIAGIAGWQLLRGGEPGETGFWAFWLGLVVAYWYGCWYSHHSTSEAAMLRKPGSVQVTLTEATLNFRTEGWSSSIAWSEVGSVQVFKDAIVIDWKDGRAPYPMPVTAMEPDQLRFLLDSALAAGARIRGADYSTGTD